jgi:hypothetical protein
MSETERVKIRRGYFARIFQTLKSDFPELFSEAYFDENDARFLAQLYFALNDDYKKWRVEEGHYTNDYKKAGLTAAAIMAMRPIQFVGSITQDDPRRFYANPVFAMACAEGILGIPISGIADQKREQLYAWLDTLRFPSTDEFLAGAVVGVLPDFQWTGLKMTFAEISAIDMIVQRYTDICRYPRFILHRLFGLFFR